MLWNWDVESGVEGVFNMRLRFEVIMSTTMQPCRNAPRNYFPTPYFLVEILRDAFIEVRCKNQ